MSACMVVVPSVSWHISQPPCYTLSASKSFASPPRGSQRVGLVPLTWASTGIQDERVGLSNLDTGLACPPAIGSVLLLRLWVRIWSGTVSKKRVQNLKILLWSLTCSRPTWIQNMANICPNLFGIWSKYGPNRFQKVPRIPQLEFGGINFGKGT